MELDIGLFWFTISLYYHQFGLGIFLINDKGFFRIAKDGQDWYIDLFWFRKKIT